MESRYARADTSRNFFFVSGYHNLRIKSDATPLKLGTKLRKAESSDESANAYLYKELVDTLMYFTVCFRSAIAHAVSYLSQSYSCYDDSRWKAAKRVLRYFKWTNDMKIIFRRTSDSLKDHIEADWANCSHD